MVLVKIPLPLAVFCLWSRPIASKSTPVAVVNTLDCRFEFVVIGQGQVIAYPDMCQCVCQPDSALLTAKICDKYNNMLLLLLLLINGFRKEFSLSQAACLLSFINKTNVTKATLKCENQRTIKYLPIRRGESLSTVLFIYMH